MQRRGCFPLKLCQSTSSVGVGSRDELVNLQCKHLQRCEWEMVFCCLDVRSVVIVTGSSVGEELRWMLGYRAGKFDEVCCR